MEEIKKLPANDSNPIVVVQIRIFGEYKYALIHSDTFDDLISSDVRIDRRMIPIKLKDLKYAYLYKQSNGNLEFDITKCDCKSIEELEKKIKKNILVSIPYCETTFDDEEEYIAAEEITMIRETRRVLLVPKTDNLKSVLYEYLVKLRSGE